MEGVCSLFYDVVSLAYKVHEARMLLCVRGMVKRGVREARTRDEG